MMEQKEILEMLIDKLVDLKIQVIQLTAENKDLKSMNKDANGIIKLLKQHDKQ